MKRLVKSRKSKISCAMCGNIIPVGTDRIIENGLHRHFMCTTRADVKRQVEDNSFWRNLINKFK